MCPAGGLGGRLALLARRLASRHLSGPVDTRLWGQRLRLRPQGSVSERRMLFVPKSWDRAERSVLASWLGPGATFVDVGANVGGYSFWALSRIGGQGTVVAVEPNPLLAKQLRYNVGVNRREGQMRVIEAAVGASRAWGTLMVPGGNSGQGRLLGCAPLGVDARQEAFRVPVVTLVDVVRDARLSRLDCLKVDVEGGEADVIVPYLTEMPRRWWPRCIVVEVKADRHPPRTAPGPGASDIKRRIVQAGYVLTRRTRLNGIFELGTRR